MSIDRTSPLKPVSTVQTRETSDTPVQKSRQEKTSAATSASVTLSDAQATRKRSSCSQASATLIWNASKH